MEVETKPKQVCFWRAFGQLLGFLVSNRGIEADTKKVGAIMEMGPPLFVRDVQKLTGCMVALNRCHLHSKVYMDTDEHE